jgi:hypothetical protein
MLGLNGRLASDHNAEIFQRPFSARPTTRLASRIDVLERQGRDGDEQRGPDPSGNVDEARLPQRRRALNASTLAIHH